MTAETADTSRLDASGDGGGIAHARRHRASRPGLAQLVSDRLIALWAGIVLALALWGLAI